MHCAVFTHRASHVQLVRALLCCELVRSKLRFDVDLKVSAILRFACFVFFRRLSSFASNFF
jgi:hypothetical protein